MRPGIKTKKARQGVAAVEMALCAPFLALIILGLLEVSNMIDVQQALHVSNRVGARFAALGRTMEADGTEIEVTTDLVIKKVLASLQRTKIIGNTNGVTVEVVFLNMQGQWVEKEPHLAGKGQIFQIKTTLPYHKFALINSRLFTPANLVSVTTMPSINMNDYKQKFEIPYQ